MVSRNDSFAIRAVSLARPVRGLDDGNHQGGLPKERINGNFGSEESPVLSLFSLPAQ
jgi:hypothetical protein